MAGLRFPSVMDKAAYARRHNYTLIVCATALDASRHPVWSKLRLVFAALREYPLVMWLDVDTLLWDPACPLLEFLNAEGNRNRSFIAQLDLPSNRIFDHYVNAGVFAIRNTTWARNVLRKAYGSWDKEVLNRVKYHFREQDALNEAMAADDNRHLRIFRYGGLWHLPYKDGTVHENACLLHFPNCKHTHCDATFRSLYRRTLNKY